MRTASTFRDSTSIVIDSVSGQQHHRRRVCRVLHGCRHGQAVEISHAEIRDDRGKRCAGRQCCVQSSQAFPPAERTRGTEAGSLDQVANPPGDLRIVVNDEDVRSRLNPHISPSQVDRWQMPEPDKVYLPSAGATFNRYVMRFPGNDLPPAKQFWSLTMYSLPQRLLVANPLDRYLLNTPMQPNWA